ncbi:MAG: 5-formyltetrahydrofolate cyclo-ligase [Candidatus Omnitrophica bacterium]|nr:5-formyltetrahydrofolate cyclo-ligase [Candidatus Omnitrophota bacterium]
MGVRFSPGAFLDMNIDVEKQRIRSEVRAELRTRGGVERLRKSRSIVAKIQKMDVFQQARTIMFYYATEEEVATQELIEVALESGKQVTLPYIDQATDEIRPSIVRSLNDDLGRGSYGIMEPKPGKRRSIELNQIDLIFVPGLAFDHKCHRLGRGKGYYDRFLETVPPHVKRFGLAFDFQVLDSIPVSDSDVSLDEVITNE